MATSPAELNGPIPMTEADAVVVGAGAFGLSAAYHLARLGAGRVLLLDRHAPASQTSPRAAGLFKFVQADEPTTRLAELSIATVRRFAAETGVEMSHVASGSLLLARTPDHAAMLHVEAAASRGWGVELEPVDAAGARRLAPYLDVRDGDLPAAYHIPGDIYVEEPPTLLAAYLEAGRRLGVTVLGHTPVTAVRTAGGAVEAVVTPRGEVRTPVVVDAAGVWAPRVGTLAGCAVLVLPLRHQLAITAPLPGTRATHPIARIVDAAAYVRPARGGLMFGGFEADPLPVDPHAGGDADGAAFTMDRVPLDRAVVERFAAAVAPQVPVLRDAPVAEHRGGLFTMTADGRLLVGPASEVRGFWTATGCNGSGFSLSSGVGRVLAEWILGGTPPIPMDRFAPARFAGRPLSAEDLRDAGIRQYANYYTPSTGVTS